MRRLTSESAIPKAQAGTDAKLQAARGDAQAFLALDKEYRANSEVVRERLYRDSVERAISAAGSVRWVPPPLGATYHGLHITLTPGNVGSSPRPSTTSTPPVVPPAPSAAPAGRGPVPPAGGEDDDDP